MRRWVPLALLLAACQAPVPQIPIQPSIKLQRLDRCEQLEAHLKAQTLTQLEARIIAYKESGFAPIPPQVGQPLPKVSSDDPLSLELFSPANLPPTPSPDLRFETANALKGDGTLAYTLDPSSLRVLTLQPLEGLELHQTVEFEGRPKGMLVTRPRHVLVFTEHVTPQGKTTRVQEVDLEDLANPRIHARLEYLGAYDRALRSEGSVHLILKEALARPAGAFSPSTQNLDDARALVDALSLKDWLPPARLATEDGWMSLPQQCEDTFIPNAPVGLGATRIITLATGAEPPESDALVLGNADQLLSSEGTLYVSTPHWWPIPRVGQMHHTYLHRFELLQAPEHTKSTGIPGHLIGADGWVLQDGLLITAVNFQERVPEITNPWGRAQLSHGAMLLDPTSLEQLGATPPRQGLSTSARILSKHAYLSDGQDRIDIVDFTVPTAPTIAQGQTGFDALLAMTELPTKLLVLGVQMESNALIDTPTYTLVLSLMEPGTLSPVETTVVDQLERIPPAPEPEAFRFDAQTGWLTVPLLDLPPAHLEPAQRVETFRSELRLFSFDGAQRFRQEGAIDMSDLFTLPLDAQFSPWVRRSLLTSDAIFALSDAGIKATSLTDKAFAESVATVRY